MIITRSPLRISLGGGGTDLPSYYREHEGFLIAAAIDRYIYISLSEPFRPEFLIKYSNLERVEKIEEIQHTIIREALTMIPPRTPFVEVTSTADIPGGTGLGSSGSFTTALLKALHTYNRNFVHPAELAEQACHLEIDRLKQPIGKQDQYIAAFGGITCFEFNRDDTVKAYPLNVSEETLFNLEDDLMFFYTGVSRSASAILEDQDKRSKEKDSSMIDNLHFTKQLGLESKVALETGDLHKFADLMNVHWEHKRKRSGGMSNQVINDWYDLAMKNGALGGKLIGAGGGGFLMFYAEDRVRLRHTMHEAGLKEVRFRFDFEGSKVLVS